MGARVRVERRTNRLFLDIYNRSLVGTDLVQAVPLMGAAALGHILFGDVQLSVTASLLIGSLPGVFTIKTNETSHAYSDEDAAEFEASLDQFLPVDTYPYLNEHGRQHLTEGPHREVSAFAFGLDLILDGLKKLPVS